MGKFITLIEDDQDIAEFLTLRMKESGLNVKTCHNGEDGLRFALSNSCAMIVLDLVLPGVMGVDLLKRVRKIKPKLPVIVISGAGSVEIQEAKEAGANICIEKPVDDREILKHLLDYMGKSK